MINPKIVEAFINRKRDSFSWMKKLKSSELDLELRRIGCQLAKPEVPFGKHQKVCFLIGAAFPRFLFWLDMGLGKTRLALELVRYWMKENPEIRVILVLVPSEPALITWVDQIAEWNIKLPFISLYNSPSREKWDSLWGFKHGLILATYPGLSAMLTTLQKVKNRKSRKRKPDAKLITKFASLIDGVVLDEATKTAHHKALPFRTVNKLVNKTGHEKELVYELAGRPFGRDPHALWSQYYLADKGRTLGDTLGMFRSAFFNEKANYWGGMEYEFKKSMQSEFSRIVKHRSIVYSAGECLDLPRLIPVVEPVILPKEAQAYYEQFVQQLRRTHAGFTERENLFIRMRQVSSGFIGVKDDLTGDKVELSFATNPKLERLMELVEEVPYDSKFVIFHEFTYSGRLIGETLNKAKIKHRWIWGGTKDSRKIQTAFDHDDKVRGLVVNWRKGAYALNLQRANFLFFYESPVPAIDREQAEKRVFRQGQTKPVFQFDLVCKNTADQRILQFHKQGASLLDALIKNPVKALGLK